ncbi:MAG: hypothetical protein GQ527_12310, partial [Bacteroidales bacterium]|nr:hypothetical protein [Bacteroidales bacterium]
YIDWGITVQQTTDGGYIITGETGSYGNGRYDGYIVKTDSYGDTLWTQTFGGAEYEAGLSIQQTTDGGYIITGFTSSIGYGQYDVYLLKIDSYGDTLWTQTYGGGKHDVGESIQQTTDGGYIITGWTQTFGNGESDVYLIKTDSSGDTLWTKTFGGGEEDKGKSIQQTTDGGYIITGWTKSYGNGETDVYLIKTDSDGDTLWTKTFGGIEEDKGISIQQTTDGGYIITGETKSFGNGYGDIYLIKTDNIGDTLWTKTYGGYFFDEGSCVQETTDGCYVITGSTASYGNGGYDVYLIKTDNNGDTLWTKTYGGENSEKGYWVQQTNDGGYIITGWTASFGIGMDMYLIKTDSEGNINTPPTVPLTNWSFILIGLLITGVIYFRFIK